MIDPRVDPPVMTYSDKIRQNAEVALKSGSTYVVLIAGVLGALYASMTVAQQTQLVEAWPVLKGWTPVIGVLVTFIVAKLKPSDSISSGTKAMIEELARLRLNAFLRDRGSPELPAPPPAPLPVPVPVVVAPVVVAPVEPPHIPWPFPPGMPPPPPVVAAPPEPPTPPAPPPEPPSSPPPPEPPPHVDVALPRVDPPTPMPIDPRLLLSLVRDYLVQTAPKP